MSISIKVEADVQQAVQGLGELSRAFDQLRQRVHAVQGDLDKLSDLDRREWQRVEHNINAGLRTPFGAFTTVMQVERGDGFLKRTAMQGQPALAAEGARGPYE